MSSASRLMRGARAIPQYAQLGSFAPTSTWASFATAALDYAAAPQPSTSGQQTLIGSSTQLTAASVGAYYSLDPARLPEASRAYAGAFYPPRDPGHERRGGCKALQQEVEATGSHAVMYRPVMQSLFSAVAARSHPRLLLTGPAGVGKSISLVGLVEWARQRGWLVLYVPSCSALVRGGYFSRRGSSGRWDTLTSAQQLLKGMLDAHGPQLRQLPVRGGVAPAAAAAEAAAGAAAEPAAVGAAGAAAEPAAVAAAAAKGRTLYDVVAGGLVHDDDPQLSVDAATELVSQMVAASAGGPAGSTPTPPVRVLFALDDYNCLYGATDYGTYAEDESPAKARRRVLHAHELVLASHLRLLDAKQLGGAVVVAANTTSTPLPAPATPPLRLPYTELGISSFSEAETRNTLAHYHATGHASCLATSRQARQLHALTQGNARELRVNASTLGLRLI